MMHVVKYQIALCVCFFYGRITANSDDACMFSKHTQWGSKKLNEWHYRAIKHQKNIGYTILFYFSKCTRVVSSRALDAFVKSNEIGRERQINLSSGVPVDETDERLEF